MLPTCQALEERAGFVCTGLDHGSNPLEHSLIRRDLFDAILLLLLLLKYFRRV